jgi:integrase
MREFKRSLRTNDAKIAKKRNAAFALEYDERLERLHDKPAGTSSPQGGQPATLTRLSPADAHELAGEFYRWLLAQHAPDPAPFESFSNVAPDGPWGRRTEPWSGQRYQLVQARRTRVPASGQQIVSGRVKEFLASRHVELSGEDFAAFCEAARDAIDRALLTLQRQHRGEDSGDLGEHYPAPRPEAPRKRPKVTITGLIKAWETGRENIRQRTRDEFARRLQQFSEFLQHDDAQAVTGKDLRRWRDYLRTKGLKAKTINESCIAPVKAIFAAAEAEDVLTTNPLADLKIALKEDKTKEKPVRPYTDGEAAKLLKAARKRADALRWLTWLLAYTGARINELAQLRKEDVMKVGSIPFLRFTTSDAKGHEIKTGASRRDVPIHRALVAEGFLKWVAKAKDGWLFSDLPAGRYGKRGDAASKRYGRWLRLDVGILDKRAVAHSWRHRMEDKLREVECPDEVADSILGHAREGQRATYGDGPPLRVKAKWIRRLE